MMLKRLKKVLTRRLKKHVRWIVFMFVLCALFQAALVLVQDPSSKHIALSKIVLAFGLAAAITFAGWYVVDQRVGTELVDGDEREYVNAAWHAGLFGAVLMALEAYFEVTNKNIEFVFEDLLLGASALCMLSEEVRLMRATMRTMGVEKVGPKFDRMVVPRDDGGKLPASQRNPTS